MQSVSEPIRAGRYRGLKQWTVDHPMYGHRIVSAPNADQAMIAAAEAWGARWQSVEFYTRVVVARM